jgi:NAD(P)-dependent dehydrogenase (short-subunit alcohol dehydrogenase family)
VDLDLKGRVAAITGGSEGIGKATALRFAELGAKIAICARRAEVLEKTASEVRKFGAEVLAVAADACADQGVVKGTGFVQYSCKRSSRWKNKNDGAGAPSLA